MMPKTDLTALAPIRSWENVDVDTFHSEILPRKEPAILKRLVTDWPAVKKARKSSRALVDYLAGFGSGHAVNAFFGDPDIKGRFFYDDKFQGFNFERRELALGELLSTLLQHIENPDPPSVYAGAIPLKNELSPIGEQNAISLLGADTEQLVSIWIGNRGRTATHWDLAQNIACVVSGHRRFTLFAPDQLRNLYMGPLDNTLAGQPISLVDLHEPDFDRYPLFQEALQNAQSAELEPGDAIYIPSMWFHHVDSLDALGVLINFWWRESAPYMVTPLLTLMHALLSIREMPEDERESWRQVFDYYIFQSDGTPMDHVPEHARGFFGDMTPERVARLRAFLIHTLGGQPRR
jgi:hypothetical protein